MLLAGYSLVQLVLVTTAIRIATYFVYRLNAYKVFPALSLNPRLFLWSRVRELTGFSVYVSIIDWANKLNYSIDAIIIGAYLGAAAVAIWTVPQRLAEMLQRLTNQFNGIIFPVVVDSDAGEKPEHLRMIFIEGTRLSLVTVLPLAAALFLLADPLIRAWVGPKFIDSIVVTQILICVIAIRVGNATATTVLKGAGEHRMLAFTNAGRGAGERRAQPVVDPALRARRPGLRHADPRGVRRRWPSCGRRRAGGSGSADRRRSAARSGRRSGRWRVDGAGRDPAARRAARRSCPAWRWRVRRARSATPSCFWHSL